MLICDAESRVVDHHWAHRVAFELAIFIQARTYTPACQYTYCAFTYIHVNKFIKNHKNSLDFAELFMECRRGGSRFGRHSIYSRGVHVHNF